MLNKTQCIQVVEAAIDRIREERTAWSCNAIAAACREQFPSEYRGKSADEIDEVWEYQAWLNDKLIKYEPRCYEYDNILNDRVQQHMHALGFDSALSPECREIRVQWLKEYREYVSEYVSE